MARSRSSASKSSRSTPEHRTSERRVSEARASERRTAAAPPPPLPEIEAVRRFNRFYTRQIGVLQEHLLQSPFSLTDVRVLYEIAHRDGPTATELAKALDLDNGYLSRILQRFTRRRLITRTASKLDARQTHLALTAHGRATFEPLQRTARGEIATLLGRLSTADRARLLEAMRTIESCLSDEPHAPQASDTPSAARVAHPSAQASTRISERTSRAAPFTLRTHRPGDLGWIVHRHGALYAQEYGWNSEFEALVADIAAHFLRHFDPARERCWIAERPGPFPTADLPARASGQTTPAHIATEPGAARHIAGSVMLVKQSDEVAKLRLLLVEPSARGLGIGKRLVDECIRFARACGYRTITLWTQSNLAAARGIYAAAGFRLVAQLPNPAFGKDDLVSETWELTL